MCEGDIFVLGLSCKLRTFDVCSSGDILDICFIEMLRGVSPASLSSYQTAAALATAAFLPGGAAVGQAKITAVW